MGGGQGENIQTLIFQRMSLAGSLGGDLHSQKGKGLGLDFVVTADQIARNDSDVFEKRNCSIWVASWV